MPSVSCSSCGKRYSVPDGASGKKFACKQCGATIRVPAGAAVAAPAVTAAKPVTASAKPPATVARKKVAAPPPPLAVESPDAGDVDLDALASLESTGQVDDSIPFVPYQQANEQPTRSTRVTAKPKSAKQFSMPRIGFRISRFVIILIVGGGALAVAGAREWMLASNASDTPQDISCADLAANGPGDNLHVRVSDFLYMRNFVWEKTSEQSDDWQTVWLPIVPHSAIKPQYIPLLKPDAKVLPEETVDSQNIHVVVKSHNVKNEGEADGAMTKMTVEGMVINKIESLTEKERDQLHQAYPAMSVENCYILEDGRQPRGGMGTLMLGGGVVLCLCGLAMMFKPR